MGKFLLLSVLLVFIAVGISSLKGRSKLKPLDRLCTEDSKLFDLTSGAYSIMQISANGFQFSSITNVPFSMERETVMFLHGFPDNFETFNHQMDKLVLDGYNVIAPALRGYEEQSCTQNASFVAPDLASDVIAIMDAYNLNKAHIVGHDWGSVVANAAAKQHPERFSSLTMMAVPEPSRFLEGVIKLPHQLLNSWYMLLFQIPLFAEWVVQLNDFALIEKLWSDWSVRYNPARLERVKKTLRVDGIIKCAVEYYRHNLPASAQDHFLDDNKKGKVNVPTLWITGEEDGCIDAAMSEAVLVQSDYPMGVRIEYVKDAGHFMHHEQPDHVSRLILEWVQGGFQSSVGAT